MRNRVAGAGGCIGLQFDWAFCAHGFLAVLAFVDGRTDAFGKAQQASTEPFRLGLCIEDGMSIVERPHFGSTISEVKVGNGSVAALGQLHLDSRFVTISRRITSRSRFIERKILKQDCQIASNSNDNSTARCRGRSS
jgi:hypothetical protein